MLSMIGAFGGWAGSQLVAEPPLLSLRRGDWPNLETWRAQALAALHERLACPALPKQVDVVVHAEHHEDGLLIEELSWQLPYGPATRAVRLRPEGQTGPLPGILGLHCHGGVKYFGHEKITRYGQQHPLMLAHQQQYYSGRAWANEVAKRGYVVLVSDAFPFASRRVRLADVSPELRRGVVDPEWDDSEGIIRYNEWAGVHESVMAKSLFSAGTTWPGVFLAEDRVALDVLAASSGVDASRLGCAGLSGGGMRTNYLAGTDSRIRCAVSVGLMTTWRDYALHKSNNHTWMTYIPNIPQLLDFPEILGLRAPLPTLVLLDEQDDLFTLPEMQRADRILTEVFARAGAPEAYRGSFYPGPHKFDAAMQQEAFDWFDRWLN
jgi:dienelactone hydrolase